VNARVSKLFFPDAKLILTRNILCWIDFFTTVLPSVDEIPTELLKKLRQLCAKEISEFWLNNRIPHHSSLVVDFKALTILFRKNTIID